VSNRTVAFTRPGVLLKDIIAEVDRLLASSTFSDFGPNGLQVPGPDEVRAVATAVSANAETIAAAAEAGADLLLVHHGLFWEGAPRHIDAAMYRRLKPLFDRPMALAAYHLPLDAHLEIGNNALLADGIGAIGKEPFGDHKGTAIGVAARFEEAIGAGDLVTRVRATTEQEPLAFAFGPDEIRSIAIVSGAGGGYLADAIAAGHDAFLTGEPSERDMAVAREGGIHYLAGGHYATETLGIRRLGGLLADRHGITHRFIADPNPI
jgi:dinuclear metal center YbgI/SA1388 family protein